MKDVTMTRAELIVKIKAKQKQLVADGQAELRRLALETIENHESGKED